jgi:WD40 repeat protein
LCAPCDIFLLLGVSVQDELADLSEQQVKHLYGHSGSITGLSYSTDQALLFSSSADGTVRLWSTQWCKNLAAYR